MLKKCLTFHMCLSDSDSRNIINSFLCGYKQIVGDVSKAYPKDTEAPSGGVDDMTKLSYLHEPGVLQNLAARYELNEIYVRFFNFFLHTYFFICMEILSNDIFIFYLFFYPSRHTLEIF